MNMSSKNTSGKPAPAPLTMAAPANPHYDKIGGETAVARLVDAFYRRMDTLPQAAAIRAMHEPDLSHTKQILRLFLSEWLGGPRRYSAERGQPHLRRRHLAFRIGEAERDAWMLCMQGALEEVVTDASVRTQLTQAFFKTADFLRNEQPH